MTRRPYFEQGGVAIYHGACVDVLAEMEAQSAGLVVTDPPYTDRVHDGAHSNRRLPQIRVEGGGPMRVIDFPSMTEAQLGAAFDAIASVAARWVIATTAFEHAAKLYENPPTGLRPIRTGAWVKTNPMPQITGDRPAQGWEAVAILHAGVGRPHWNGGGKPATWVGPSAQSTTYPTQKPEWLITRFLVDFADPGDDVLDPFMGSGTTLLCAWRRGHKATGCDVREEACEIAAKRIEAAMRQGRLPTDAARAKVVQGTMAF